MSDFNIGLLNGVQKKNLDRLKRNNNYKNSKEDLKQAQLDKDNERQIKEIERTVEHDAALIDSDKKRIEHKLKYLKPKLQFLYFNTKISILEGRSKAINRKAEKCDDKAETYKKNSTSMSVISAITSTLGILLEKIVSVGISNVGFGDVACMIIETVLFIFMAYYVNKIIVDLPEQIYNFTDKTRDDLGVTATSICFVCFYTYVSVKTNYNFFRIVGLRGTTLKGMSCILDIGALLFGFWAYQREERKFSKRYIDSVNNICSCSLEDTNINIYEDNRDIQKTPLITLNEDLEEQINEEDLSNTDQSKNEANTGFLTDEQNKKNRQNNFIPAGRKGERKVYNTVRKMIDDIKPETRLTCKIFRLDNGFRETLSNVLDTYFSDKIYYKEDARGYKLRYKK